MKKKILALILMWMIIISNVTYMAVENNSEPQISSSAAILVEQSTKRVLYGKNERKKVKIASTTKILTAIVAVENKSLEDKVTISKKAAGTGGSTVGLKAGSEVTLKSLLYGLLLKSGNDCAVAIAEYVGGSTENFVKMMNEKAYEIGAKDTYCTNPHGLDTEDNHSTAYDLALITCYAKSNETISKIMGTESITLPFGTSSKYLANTNRLLFTYQYCDGGKTGFTNIANRCLVATAVKDDLKVVAVILGANTTDIRFKEGRTLLEYGIENYTMVDMKDEINWYIDIPVYKGDIYSYVKRFNADFCLPLKTGEIEEIYISQSIIPNLYAPVSRGSYIGNIKLMLKDEVLYNKDIYLEQDISKNTVLDYMIRGIKSIFETNC